MAMLKTKTYRSCRADDPHSWGPKNLEDYLLNKPISTDIDMPNADVAFSLNRVDDIERYLNEAHGHENRVLAYAHSDWISSEEPSGWADEMIELKQVWNKLGGIPMYQFIISPDPKDKVGIDECLELAQDWAQEQYPDAQWVIEIHDDNEKRIPHAHIIINSVLPETGKKIHRSKWDIHNEAASLQRLCEEHGMSKLDTLNDPAERFRKQDIGHDLNQAVRMDRAERAFRKTGRGHQSWQVYIRDAVDECARKSKTWMEFEILLSERGIQVESHKRGITYVLEDFKGTGPRRWKSSKMGDAYSARGVAERFSLEFDASTGKTSFTSPHWRAINVPPGLVERPRKPKRPLLPQEQTLAQRADRYMLRRRRGVKAIWDLTEAIAIVEENNLKTMDGLSELQYSLSGELGELESHIIRYENGIKKAGRVLDLGKDLEKWNWELIDLTVYKKPFSISQRTRRKELEQLIADGKAEAIGILESARGFIEAQGVNLDEDPVYAASVLISKIGELADSSKERADAIVAKLDGLSKAERQLMDALPYGAEARMKPYEKRRSVTIMGLEWAKPKRDGVMLSEVETYAPSAKPREVKNGRRLESDEARRRIPTGEELWAIVQNISKAFDREPKVDAAAVNQQIQEAERVVRENERARMLAAGQNVQPSGIAYTPKLTSSGPKNI